jgi:hypothetical protein
MGAPFSAVVDISVNPSGRRMLSNLQAKYDISIDSGLTEAALQANLRQALDSGSFIYVLKFNTGITTLKVSNFVILKISPTHLPTAAPVESSGETIFILLTLFVLLLCQFFLLFSSLIFSIPFLS